MAKGLIGTGIKTAAGAIATKQSNAASERALAQQQAAADKAVDFEKEMYERTRSDLAPYQNAGASAMTTLGALMGLPAGASSTTMNAPLSIGSGTQTTQTPSTTDAAPATTPPPLRVNAQGVPTGRSDAAVQARYDARNGGAAPVTQSGMTPTTNTITVQAPGGGATRVVPRSQMDYWVKKGAQVVG